MAGCRRELDLSLCSNRLDIGEMVECEDQYDQCYKAVINCNHETFHLRGCSKIKRLGKGNGSTFCLSFICIAGAEIRLMIQMAV